MFRLNLMIFLLSVLSFTSANAELIAYDRYIIQDNASGLYWYKPLFYNQADATGFDVAYEFFLYGIELMNGDPDLSSNKWGRWHIADQNEIDKLLENNPMQFRMFDPSDGEYDLLLYDRMYYKPNPKPVKTGRLSVVIPRTEFFDDYPMFEIFEPSVTMDYVEKDMISAGSAGYRGVWAVANGTASDVPEPSVVTFVISGLSGLLLYRSTKLQTKN